MTADRVRGGVARGPSGWARLVVLEVLASVVALGLAGRIVAAGRAAEQLAIAVERGRCRSVEEREWEALQGGGAMREPRLRGLIERLRPLAERSRPFGARLGWVSTGTLRQTGRAVSVLAYEGAPGLYVGGALPPRAVVRAAREGPGTWLREHFRDAEFLVVVGLSAEECAVMRQRICAVYGGAEVVLPGWSDGEEVHLLVARSVLAKLHAGEERYACLFP